MWLKLLLLTALLAIPNLSTAQVPDSYTNDNFFSDIVHDRPISLFVDSAGNFFGETKNGFTFRQEKIPNTLGIRLQRFSIDQAFFYVSDRGTIRADSDISAISIYLARGA